MEVLTEDFGKMGCIFTVKHSRLKLLRLFIGFIFLLPLACFIELYTQELFILWGVVFLLVIILILRLNKKVISERLLVLPTIGLQIQSENWLGTLVTEFIEISCVKDVVINEAIRPFTVTFYLCVLTGDKKSQEIKEIRPLFTHSWLKLEDLKKVYSAIQIKLFKYQKEKTS
ncbi:hypothetical protein LOTGIDRAFT_238050 [Lottia gigantea]|uniref:Phosphatidylinositol N-acetylglucosaminyltransferase subunit H conserved domain-containing protein n=1 Tax=Lottia gigantea TaxID=225164 RepID=V4B4E6_LOTGI|nr:hypothetical protein LOTGIDRAFT_238050 [Lottia gigantea]ESP02326.1 hypothetical protein LOTGIDRAFT_238050 [Lottia gigantea]